MRILDFLNHVEGTTQISLHHRDSVEFNYVGSADDFLSWAINWYEDIRVHTSYIENGRLVIVYLGTSLFDRY